MVVFSIIIFLCQLVFAYLMATITACLTNADAARARFSEKLTNAKLYMEHEKLDISLRQRVVEYYQYLWQRTKGVEPQQLFLNLPRSIWGSVSYCLYADLIRLWSRRRCSLSVLLTTHTLLYLAARRLDQHETQYKQK